MHRQRGTEREGKRKGEEGGGGGMVAGVQIQSHTPPCAYEGLRKSRLTLSSLLEGASKVGAASDSRTTFTFLYERRAGSSDGELLKLSDFRLPHRLCLGFTC